MRLRQEVEELKYLVKELELKFSVLEKKVKTPAAPAAFTVEVEASQVHGLSQYVQRIVNSANDQLLKAIKKR